MRARAALVVNEREQRLLVAIAPGASVHVVPNGIDVPAFAPAGPASPEPVAVFCGVMDYGPNVDAVVWFARRVWPRVRAERPDARFVIVGANPTRAVSALAAEDPSISVTGRVDAVQPHLWRAALAVAPLRLAQGIQNKVLEAMAAGLPVVMTSAVRLGLPAGVELGCLTADEPEPFARAVIDLLNEPPARRRLTAAASDVEGLAWSTQLKCLKPLFDDAAGAAARRDRSD
jgi:glycosyltransferase involved in cell wall biosynthesis